MCLRVPRGCLVLSPPSCLSWPGGLSTSGEFFREFSILVQRVIFCRNRSVRKASLFDEMDEVDNETNKENNGNDFWHFKKYC